MELPRMRFVLLTAFASLICSCASTPLIGSLSPQAAQREAHRDIQSGRMKIYLAGTIGTYEVGVDERDRALVAKLPRAKTLPVGCNHPEASAGIDYARAYNKEIIHYLRGQPST
jgi:hypothetical protein